jgi:lipoprotein-releasing system permease protein
MGIFLKQGVILGIVGSLVGVVIGYIVCRYMATIEVSPQRGLGTGRMIVSFAPRIYFQAILLGFGSATLASFLPARAAGKMEPIEIIRTEGS